MKFVESNSSRISLRSFWIWSVYPDRQTSRIAFWTSFLFEFFVSATRGWTEGGLNSGSFFIGGKISDFLVGEFILGGKWILLGVSKTLGFGVY